MKCTGYLMVDSEVVHSGLVLPDRRNIENILHLGSGKTLSQTFLLWKNWFYRRKPIYANHHLFKIPYCYIEYIEQFDQMREGDVGADELWVVIDSRCAKEEKNRFVASILLKSRKRGLTYFFTAQMLELLDKRVRKVIDFTSYPVMNAGESVCKIMIFRTGFPKEHHYMKTVYFKTGLVFDMFDTEEEIAMKSVREDMESGGELDGMTKKEIVDIVKARTPVMKIVFQENYNKEHGYWCTCEECGTKFFDTWGEADRYAEDYWKKKVQMSKLF